MDHWVVEELSGLPHGELWLIVHVETSDEQYSSEVSTGVGTRADIVH